MHLSFILGFLLVSQQPVKEQDIIVRDEGNIIAIENRNNLYFPLIGWPFINTDYIQPLLEKWENEAYMKPQNATLDEHGAIVSEKTGFQLDKGSLISQLYQSLYSSGPSVVDIKKIPVYPEVDSEILSQIREKQIGQYLTYFNSGNRERSLNIDLAAKAINNHVVFPGQTFSFNQVVGKRTKGKGYLPAPIIVKGELSEGVGGGICQVSSTLFNAVDRSGLKVVERYSHSRDVPYVPKGRDATVSWYGPDFRFTNKYNQPILIKAKVYHGKLIVSIYSSDSINFKPRKIPSASNVLPEEIKVSNDIQDRNSN
ncbi:VanW family protein [Pseudoneobacillus sp. C159]